MNVVVVVRGGLVETLQAGPALRSVADGLPGTHVTLACPASAGDLAGCVEGPDQVMLSDGLDGAPSLGGLLRIAAELRSRRLDCALVCSSHAADVTATYLAGIPRRVGAAAGAASRLLTDRVPLGQDENAAQSWLRLVAALGPARIASTARLVVDDAARRDAERRLVGGGIEDGRLLVAMAPGQAWETPPPGAVMTWSPERYAYLGNHLFRRHGAGVVLLGPEADRPAVDATKLDLEARTLDLCGEIGLREAAAVVERCDLLVASDSPLLHVAAAVGTPAVGLFGPTDGRRRGPYGHAHRVIQGLAPDDRPRARVTALTRIRVDDVLAGIEAELGQETA